MLFFLPFYLFIFIARMFFLPFYLFTFLLLNVPSIYFFFLTFAPETLKEMKTYEKERDYSTTLDRGDDDDAGSMCLFSTGG